MTYDDLHPTIRMLIGCHEGLRKAGFPSDNIYVDACRAPGIAADEVMCFSLLKWRGKEFRIGCGTWKRDDAEGLQRQWTDACVAVRDRLLPQEDWDRCWQESFIFKEPIEFLLRLKKKGITPPRGVD